MSLRLYPLSNYSFAVKGAQIEEDASVNARLLRLYVLFVFRESKCGGVGGDGHRDPEVEGLMVVHEHGHPHILLLQVANAFYKLPGDYLRPHENDIDGLTARLDKRFGAVLPGEAVKEEKMQIEGLAPVPSGEWEVQELLAQWWRPNFEGFMYPYIPAHISKPKEVKSLYLIQLPERQMLTVPSNMKILAIPLFELFDNAVRYGPLLAAVPHLLSKFEFIYED